MVNRLLLSYLESLHGTQRQAVFDLKIERLGTENGRNILRDNLKPQPFILSSNRTKGLGHFCK
jgi:hypothetical protein